MIDKLFYEKKYLEKGLRYICGVDEVGRGPLAGPVTATAIVMDLDKIINGVDDSKKLSEKNRESISLDIVKSAICYSTVCIENEVIDQINILNATKRAMKQAIMSLELKPDVVLIDAVKLDIPFKNQSIIKGDMLSYSIGCASIIAKVFRDRLMRNYDAIYPEYLFASNKGYGSAKHIEAIKSYGATPIHRKSFIKNYIK